MGRRKAGKKVSGGKEIPNSKTRIQSVWHSQAGQEQRSLPTRRWGWVTCQESRTFSSASTSSLPISLSTPFHTLCLSKEHHYSYDGSSLNPLYLASPSHRRLLFCPPKGVISFSPPDHGSPTHPSHHPLPPRCLVTDGSISTDNPLQSVLHIAAEWV